MGRAIDMEKQMDVFKIELQSLKDELSDLKATLSEMLDVVSTKKNVDIIEETKGGKTTKKKKADK